MPTPLYILIVLLAIPGFFISLYIFRKKRRKEVLLCPLKANCQDVINSEYARFLGIPLEYLGLAYYTGVAALYAAALLLRGEAYASDLTLFALLLSGGGFLFSLYLTFIQAFVLKFWCSWCLFSASLSTMIFLSGLGAFELSSPIFWELTPIMIVSQFIGISLGVGGATTFAMFFLKFLRDFRISEWEANVLRTISQMLWLALAVLVVSGFSLYLAGPQYVGHSPTFTVKAITVAVLIASGTLLNLVVSPKLLLISFGAQHEHRMGELHKLRRWAFGFGASSFISWYMILVLEVLPYEYSLTTLLYVYIIVLSSALVASQLFERALSRNALSTTKN